MNKLRVRLLSVLLCTTMCLGSVAAVHAQNTEKQEEPQVTAPLAENPEIAAAPKKDETVYVLAGADGTVQKVIVSDWIKNALNENSLSDKTDLSNIENVKGDENYTVNDANATVWDAKGNDIYYRGNIDKELPVGLKVSYTLDGQPVSASEIAGKSGKVTIRFDYDNRQFKTVQINGKDEKIYVPFAILTGMLLDNDVFSNITISNGKMMNDGEKTVVVGFALPGLAEDLALDSLKTKATEKSENADVIDAAEKLEIPDYVEITADVTNFEFGMTVTIATNEIFNNFDANKLDYTDGLKNTICELTSGMDKLIDGSSALYDGICTLLDKSGELVKGINDLADGAKSLKDGVAKLDTGAANLKKGADSLSSGLNKICENNKALNSGSKQVFESLLATATQQLTAAGIAVPELTIENYEMVLNGVIKNLSDTVAYLKAIEQPSPVEAATLAGTEAGLQSVTGLKASLDSYNAFYQGLLAYTGGVASAAEGAKGLSDGAKDLKGGIGQIKDGANQLSDGANQLKNGVPALTDGITQLKDGSMELCDGLKKFNEEGIQKIADLVNCDLDDFVSRLKATADVSKAYRNFAGISDEMDGQVKFIYRTDEIKTK